MDPEFPGNSQHLTDPPSKDKPIDKGIEKVVTSDVVQKPKSLGRRFKALFIRGEFRGASKYILGDVLLPAVKNTIVDAVTKGIERVVYGNTPPRRYDPRGPRVSYNSPVRRPGMLPDQPPLRDPRLRQQNVGDIILNSREDATMVIERLSDIIDKFEVASIADLHELCGLPSTYVDNKWGWMSLGYANIRQVREGFLLDLPPVEPID